LNDLSALYNEQLPMKQISHDIVLGSSSPYRQQQFAKLGLSFTTSSPNINEERRNAETPKQLVERLSLQKALEVQKSHPTSIIIGSDQVAYIKEEQQALSRVHILTKPLTIENAVNQLLACSGRKVRFVTGLCCIAPNAEPRILSENVDVTFRQLSLSEIERYIEIESPLDCAGSFKVEGLGIALFEKVESTDPNTLIGLPIIALNKILIELGVNALQNPNHLKLK
jgi:septum formation protein